MKFAEKPGFNPFYIPHFLPEHSSFSDTCSESELLRKLRIIGMEGKTEGSQNFFVSRSASTQDYYNTHSITVQKFFSNL